MVQGLKSRVDDYLASPAGARYPSRSALSPKELERLIPEWHAYEAGGAGLCFDAMGLFPSFFSSCASHKVLYPIDAFPIVACVRDITHMFDMRVSVQLKDPSYHLWEQGGPSRLFSAVVGAHIESCQPRHEPSGDLRPDLESSWIGIAVVVGMYLTSVLGVWNQGKPEESHLLCYILRSSHLDLKRSFSEFNSYSHKARDFWFWKLFVTALHFGHARMEGCDTKILELGSTLTNQIRAWSDITGTRSWQDAKAKLASIAWPVVFKQERLARLVWDEALLL
ncbi:hypothetical protein ACHAPJ_006558 [Fusarium lateritium]